MGRVLTNNTSLSYSIESGLGVAGTDWRVLEPNDINSFGTDITTVARDPISRNRQRRKGTVTDLDSAVEFEHDLTLAAFSDFVEGFAFSAARNKDLEFTGSDAGASGYSVAALSSAQADKLFFTGGGPISLMYARGYVNSDNNGLKALAAAASATDVLIEVSGLAAETAPPNAILEIAGIRAEEGDLALAIAGNQGTLTSDNNGAANPIDFRDLGLSVGQFIHIGGVLAANQFPNGRGFARIRSIGENELLLDKLSSELTAHNGADVTLDLLFGQFVRNVPVDHPDFLERSFQFELASPNLMPMGATGYEYSIGNFCDALQFELPLTNKATMTVGFIGLDTEVPTGSRKTGAAAALDPVKTGAFNTSADIARLRVADVDEQGLTTDFKSLSITLNNNVSPEKVLGQLGARYMNTGNFEVDLEAQILFTEPAVIEAIRTNQTVSMDFSIRNDDGALYVDIPSMTLGGGDREMPRNESVMMNLTGEAFGDPLLGTSLSVSTFPVLPQ